ncbi:tetratricopeptide repeat protein [Vibrio intestinalis]|uniref:tetratricopeptide repeat protein n=1 Tax=Vibrio intestinalis TaxID=2933291 RepID=UPI0021A44A44|nr:tetratricopeptide repeat protein [Vibrio intestinalis]
MNMIGIAIGATGLLLLFLFVWMLALSIRKKRVEQERRQREIALRKAMERDRKMEEEQRVMKAEGGDITMILYLAKEAERTNLRQALYWYHKAAELDNITGMYGIVRISDRMREDLVLKEQAKYWRTAIDAHDGVLQAKFEMAESLIHGRGVEPNLEKGIFVMEQAAKQRHLEAILFLGDWFIAHNNPDPSPSTSTEWFRRATAMRSNEGRMKLGLNYIHGLGVAADHAQGCYWLERAAEKGYTPAMVRLGEIWVDHGGSGRCIAYIWLFLAGQLGNDEARMMRDKVALNIGVDTVVGLQALSKPMLKRIRENKVSKHSLIKALNKLYKRDIPYDKFDMSPAMMAGEDMVVEGEADLFDNLEQVDVIEAPMMAEPQAEAAPLDFSQSSVSPSTTSSQSITSPSSDKPQQ